MTSLGSPEWHLERIIALLPHSARAQMLARSLWHFFDRQLTCRLPTIDTQLGSSCSIDIHSFLRTHRAGDLKPGIVVRHTERSEEATAHELLHLNLIPLGYPRFSIDEPEDDEEKWQFAGGITNYADHLVMLPAFLAIGYVASRFVGPSRPPSIREQAIFDELNPATYALNEPKKYLKIVSECLQKYSIRHQPVWVAGLIRYH